MIEADRHHFVRQLQTCSLTNMEALERATIIDAERVAVQKDIGLIRILVNSLRLDNTERVTITGTLALRWMIRKCRCDWVG